MNTNQSPDSEGQRVAARLTSTLNLEGEDEEDTRLLCKMSEDAKQYIGSFSWCDKIYDSYFAGGIAGIFGVFFFHIQPSRNDVDPWIWIVIGDIPSAYLPLIDCKSPLEVFQEYIRGMNKWVELARFGQTGTSEPEVPPVNIPATPEWAEDIQRRLQYLILLVKPFFEDESEAVH